MANRHGFLNYKLEYQIRRREMRIPGILSVNVPICAVCVIIAHLIQARASAYRAPGANSVTGQRLLSI